MLFNMKLIDLLKTDPRFLDDDGEIVLAAAQDSAWKIDRSLVRLLLADAEIKVNFFEIISGQALEKQNQLLAELLDENQLYVNLSEIDDAQFNVNKDDKALNKAFYGDSL